MLLNRHKPYSAVQAGEQPESIEPADQLSVVERSHGACRHLARTQASDPGKEASDLAGALTGCMASQQARASAVGLNAGIHEAMLAGEAVPLPRGRAFGGGCAAPRPQPDRTHITRGALTTSPWDRSDSTRAPAAAVPPHLDDPTANR